VPYPLKVHQSDRALANKVVVGVAAGVAHSAFLTSDGYVYTAGSNAHGKYF